MNKTAVYRLYLIKNGEEIFYGSSNYVDYMSELIGDYVRNNGKISEEFSFKVTVSVREKEFLYMSRRKKK